MQASSNAQVAALGKLVEDTVISADINFSYTEVNDGFYTIIKKSTKDPFRVFPVMQMMIFNKPPYLDDIKDIPKQMCEFLAEKEYRYNKEHPKEE